MSSEFWALWSWIWPPFGWTHTTDTAVRPCIHNPHASQSHHQTWRSTEHLFVAVIEDSPINLAPLQVLQIGWKGRRLRQGLSWDTGGGRACCHKVGCCQQEQKHISLHESISMAFAFWPKLGISDFSDHSLTQLNCLSFGAIYWQQQLKHSRSS